MELAQLTLVKQILETGSLSKTAMRLNRAQSVVSRQLAALERECGGRIFYRNGRGVLLTELGERVLPQIELILAAANDIAGSGAQLKSEVAGEVKITLTPHVAPNLIGPLFTKLKQSYPNIRLSVWEGYSSDIETELQEGRTDVAVFLRSGTTVAREDRAVCELDTYLIGLPDSPATANESIPFSQLAGLPLLMPSSPSACRRAMESIAASKGMTLNIAAEVNAPGSTAALLRAGAGYLVTPLGVGAASGMSIGADIQAKLLRASRIVEPSFTRKLVIGTGVNPRRRVDAVARVVETMLRDMIKPEAAGGVGGRWAPAQQERRAMVG
ncbi:MAG TPA: LysR family transcriptional regulator [Caulobacterales bacterium]|nr:LysR family transcriptional regulator [Caulobacterales bacterium]